MTNKRCSLANVLYKVDVSKIMQSTTCIKKLSAKIQLDNEKWQVLIIACQSLANVAYSSTLDRMNAKDLRPLLKLIFGTCCYTFRRGE